MDNKIFIGGFGGVGSRLLPQIFEKFGLYVGKELSGDDRYGRGLTYDFGSSHFVKLFNIGFHQKDYTLLFEYLNKELKDYNNFAIKHGHFMFIMDEIKKEYSEAKNIYIMRNPIDAALKLEYKPHYYYGGLPANDLDAKIQYYIDESIKACNNADLVIKYEDLCNDLESEIIKLTKFMGLDSYPIESIIPIKSSSNIGVGKDLYNKFDLSKLGY